MDQDPSRQSVTLTLRRSRDIARRVREKLTRNADNHEPVYEIDFRTHHHHQEATRIDHIRSDSTRRATQVTRKCQRGTRRRIIHSSANLNIRVNGHRMVSSVVVVNQRPSSLHSIMQESNKIQPETVSTATISTAPQGARHKEQTRCGETMAITAEDAHIATEEETHFDLQVTLTIEFVTIVGFEGTSADFAGEDVTMPGQTLVPEEMILFVLIDNKKAIWRAIA